jgi:choline dehydrogenase-like flavoprotein
MRYDVVIIGGGSVGTANAHQHEPMLVPRGKVTSGTSAIYGQVVLRSIPEDYDNWAVWGNDAWSYRQGTAHHLADTSKMGRAADSMAVVDQCGRVRGLNGLRVVDASIMPDVVRANTNATIIIMAERIADWIKVGK